MSDRQFQRGKRVQLDLVGEPPPRKKMKFTAIKTVPAPGKREQFVNKTEEDKHQEEEAEEEEEEEEDIDVLLPSKNVTDIANRSKGTDSSKIFGIGTILSNIVSHLSLNEIIKLRRTNTLFNDELAFRFECDNFSILFSYKNKYIIDIINDQCCGTLEKFTLFYLQSINLKKLGFALKTKDDETTCTPQSRSVASRPNVKIMGKEKSGLNTMGIVKVAVDSSYLTKESSDYSNNFDIDFNEENGNCEINPFKSIHLESKLVNERLVNGEYCKNDTINTLLLSRFYQYKPLANKLGELMEFNKDFSETMRMSDDAIDGQLGYVWQSIKGATDFFSWYSNSDSTETCTVDVVRGRPALLSDSSLFGNFDVYEKYIKSLNGNVLKIRESFSIMNGIFGLFGVFLRDDLAKDYVHYDGEHVEGEQTLLYVIQPWMFNKYKELLVENCMFMIDDDKTKWEFDLINNPRYHPLKRIEYLKVLTNSTQFCKSLLHFFPNNTEKYRLLLVRTINRLYHSFDNFKEDWMLDKYNDLKGNINKQKEIHESFKYLIQFLFCICEFYVDYLHQRQQPLVVGVFSNYLDTIFESNLNNICNEEVLNIKRGIDNGYKFIDLSDDMIKNDRDLEILLETMIAGHNFSEDWILEKILTKPLYNRSLFTLRMYNVPDVSSIELHLDPWRVSDIRVFLRKRWNFR